MSAYRWGVGVASAVMTLVAGCSSATAGNPSPGTGAAESDLDAPSRSNGPTEQQVPSVDDPMDVSAFVDRPCDLLERDYLDDLGFAVSGEPAVADDGGAAAAVGPSCEWILSDSVDSIFVQLQTGNRDTGSGGLAGPYEAYESGHMAYLEPLTVSSYPAVFAARADNRENGECSIVVGVRDDLTFSVISGPMKDRPDEGCSRTKRIAAHVIETLDGSQ